MKAVVLTIGLLVGALSAAQAAAAAPAVAAPPAAPAEYIGMATMEADGTIVLDLRADGPGGMIGHGQVRYPPTHKDYAVVARHVGPIPAGGSVPVRPFPD